MGNFPYASNYLMHGASLLPPWPVRTACSHLAPIDAATASDRTLFEAVRRAVATQYNNTGDVTCYDITHQLALDAARPRKMTSPPRRGAWPPLTHSAKPTPTLAATSLAATTPVGATPVGATPTATPADRCVGDWGYQWCTEMTQPFTQGTPDDLFYCPPDVNCSAWTLDTAGCMYEWGVAPRADWARVALGGKRIAASSNIVFSNGLQDPWHGGGVLTNMSETVLAIVLPNGAHHIDLMFSDPADADYPDIGWAREFERTQMRRWVVEHRNRTKKARG